MTVPPGAITGAAGAIDELLAKPDTLPIDRGQAANRFALAAVEAAAPLIAAAERDRIIRLAEQQSRAPLSAQSPIASQALREFADLLRGDRP